MVVYIDPIFYQCEIVAPIKHLIARQTSHYKGNINMSCKFDTLQGRVLTQSNLNES